MNLKIRHYLLTGLLVWLPMGVTVWLLTWLVGTMDGIFLAILGALDAVIPGMHELAESLRHTPGLGVILVALVIYFTGLFVTNIFGQWLLRQWSKILGGGTEPTKLWKMHCHCQKTKCRLPA